MNIKLSQEDLNLLIELITSLEEVINDDIVYQLNNLAEGSTYYCSILDLKTKLFNFIELQNNLIEFQEEN